MSKPSVSELKTWFRQWRPEGQQGVTSLDDLFDKFADEVVERWLAGEKPAAEKAEPAKPAATPGATASP